MKTILELLKSAGIFLSAMMIINGVFLVARTLIFLIAKVEWADSVGFAVFGLMVGFFGGFMAVYAHYDDRN